MPTDDDRKAFEKAITKNNKDQIRAFLQRDDAKELLMMKKEDAFGFGYFPIHEACWFAEDASCLLLILDAGVQHGIVEQMLQLKDNHGQTCLHFACMNSYSTDPLRPLLEYLLKQMLDTKQMLEEKEKYGATCLHTACQNKDLSPDSLRLLLELLSNLTDNMLEKKTGLGQTCLHRACEHHLSPDSVRLLISFFPSKNLLATVLDARDYKSQTPADWATKDEVKQLLQDSDCFEKCRLWLFDNHQETFLYSLFPHSFERTCDALTELAKNGLQETPECLTIMLMALTPTPSFFREAVNKTDSSAPMSSYFDVVKKGDRKSDYNHWRKNIHLFRELCGQWPPSGRKTAITYEGEDSSSCSIQ